MLQLVRNVRGWLSASKSIGGFHWRTFPVFGKEPWKRQHINGFIAKLSLFPIPHDARCIVDVGANIGTFAAAVAAYCPDADLYAFEPSTRACHEFRKLVPSSPRVSLVQSAVGDKPGTAELRISENLFSSSLTQTGDTGVKLLGPAAEFTGQVEQVPVMVLDQWVAEKKIGAIDLLKIDVEGFEPEVIAGARQAIQQSVRRIMIEISIARLGFKQAWDLVVNIEALGFTLLYLDDVSRSGAPGGPCTQFDAWFLRR